MSVADPESYRERILSRLPKTAPVLAAERNWKLAAVLIPIVERSVPAVLFTRRTEHLPSHAGQVCFPGGRFDADDESLVATALREAEEETGIAPEFVELVGFLDPYKTINSGFLILPVVGFVKPEFTPSPNAEEVAEMFEVPLDFLLDPANRERRTLERGGMKREVYAITHGSHTIWGATADMVVNFSVMLGGS